MSMNVSVSFKVRVLTQNYITDFMAGLKNIVGGRLKAYEKMIEESIQELLTELHKEHPNIKNIKIDVDEFTIGALVILVYGDSVE